MEVLNGKPIGFGDITHSANLGMTMLDHREQLPMFDKKLGHYAIDLEITWLESHDMVVQFA